MGIVTTSCDSTFVGVEEIVCHFGEMSVETTPKSATITAPKPYLTVDGKPVDAKISLHYIGAGHDIVECVEEYREEDGEIIFEIDRLTPETQYKAYISLNGGEYGIHRSKEIRFTTDALHVAEISMHLEAEVAAKGLMATLSISDITYLVDGKSTNIAFVEVAYKRNDATEWQKREFNASLITNGALSVGLPFEKGEYLTENSDYRYRITLDPIGDNSSITSDEFEFKTLLAEVTANIPQPTLSLQGVYISATVENVEVFYDGIPAAEYKGNYPVEYSLWHRLKGAETWTTFAIANGNGTIGIKGEEGATYEFKAVVEDATEQCHESQIAEITVPKNEPPTPPVSGGGDTSSIAGVWHLTTWRDAVPSFDIYLDITADGVVTLYQRLESRAWECFYSSAAIEDGIIKGTYSDGVAWGASYYVSVEGETMTWEDTADSSDISVYTRSELPEDITTTRGAETTGEERFL